MLTSYIIDKAGLTALCLLIGKENISMPENLLEGVSEENAEAVLDRLARVGYIFRTADRIDIERTVFFLISNALRAKNVSGEPDGKRYIFRCSKLIIIIEEDRLSSKKCRIIPIRDEEMLKEFYSGSDTEPDYTEEE